jgi:hypothetical protein
MSLTTGTLGFEWKAVDVGLILKLAIRLQKLGRNFNIDAGEYHLSISFALSINA